MKALKVYEGLTAFLIDNEGNVYGKDGQPQPMETKTHYKLLTDEVMARTMAKSKVPVRLVRRFTKEEVVKMYNSIKATPTDVKIINTNTAVGTMAVTPDTASAVINHVDDRVAASKRTVKSNPKTPVKLKKKVAKAAKEGIKEGIKEAIKKAGEPSFTLNINGKPYKSAREASKELGVSVNTVLSRCRKGTDGWLLIEGGK